MSKKESFNNAAHKFNQYQEYKNATSTLDPYTPSPSKRSLELLIHDYTSAPDGPNIARAEKKFPELPILRRIFGLPEMIHRMKLALEKDEFRPRNLRILDFVANPELNNITGRFNTFDIKLSRMQRAYQYSRYMELTRGLPTDEAQPSIDIMQKLLDKYAQGKLATTDKFIASCDEKWPRLKFLRWAFITRNNDDMVDLSMLISRLRYAITNHDKCPPDTNIIDFAATPVDKNGKQITIEGNKTITADRLRKYNTSHVTNVIEVGLDYQNNWLQILQKHPKWTRALIENARNMDEKTLSHIFNTFAHDMLAAQNLSYKHFNVWIVNDWDSPILPQGLVPDAVKNDPWAKGLHYLYKLKTSPNIRSAIVINIHKYAEIHKNNLELFAAIMNALSHEYGHFIDKVFNEHHGMVGPQSYRIDEGIYVNHIDNADKYYQSATEFSSYEIGEHLGQVIKQKYKSK